MEKNKIFIKCDDARDFDMVSFLSGLGFEPAKIRSQDYWYFSPLRSENTPSFKVNRKLNRWYDHGLGQGGNLIDFGILFNNCTVKDFLESLAGTNGTLQQVKPVVSRQGSDSSQIQILHETELKSSWLLSYLKVRQVPIALANLYCREVTYRVESKEYNAIAFKNDSGGYELRNPKFKGSCSPKDITTFPNSADQMTVFEGFFDFLSFNAALPSEELKKTDFIVLNSLAFFEKSRPLMERYRQINLYLDRDKAGHNCSLNAQALSQKYLDRSSLYKGYKDVNDWAMHIGKRPQKIKRQL